MGRVPRALWICLLVIVVPVATAFAQPFSLRDWQRLDTGQGFGFYAPAGAGVERRQGIDSAVGEIVAPGFRLQYDFGFYSNPLEGMRSQSGYSEYETRIDGRRAIVRKAILRGGDGPRYLIGLYMERADWVWGMNLLGAWRKLGISGAAATERDRDTVERMFSTIHFDHRLPVTIQR